MTRYSALALGLAMLCGCAHAPNPADPHDLMAIGDRIFHLGCPSAATVTERKVPNPHQPTVIDTIKTTSCDGTYRKEPDMGERYVTGFGRLNDRGYIRSPDDNFHPVEGGEVSHD